jgi:predicted N-formylglutamate amidohydrolase
MFSVRKGFTGLEPAETGDVAAAEVENAHGDGRIVVLCDHASNRLPQRYGTLGLDGGQLNAHYAWDPGAMGLARVLAAALGAPLVASTVSRLVIDCNRDPSASDSIVEIGETTPIPGNAGLSSGERQRRVAEVYEPFHAAASQTIATAAASGPIAVVSVHSFTPVFKAQARPWHVGILFDHDERLARPLLAELAADTALVVGENQPYSPRDRVYHTLDRHAQRHGLPCAMIEVRNDLIATPKAQQAWGERLAKAIGSAMSVVFSKTGGDDNKKAGSQS